MTSGAAAGGRPLTWRDVDGELTAFDEAGRKQFTIEIRTGGRPWLRRWSTQLDGAAVMGCIQACSNVEGAKLYAASIMSAALANTGASS